MRVRTSRIVADLAKMADEARGIWDNLRRRQGGVRLLADWLGQSRDHYAGGWKRPERARVVCIEDFRELADMAAGAWQDAADLPPEEQGNFADAVLETSLDLQRRHFSDGWKTEIARRSPTVRRRRAETEPVRTRCAMDGFRALLRDAAFIIDAASARYPGLIETTHVQRVIEDNLAQSRAHHFPPGKDRTP